ncbi:MAG: hypothetical protein U5L04_03785 [Trueperaceae bacterium]|nr:hypothetical protein [Trueperaceae bacterium]
MFETSLVSEVGPLLGTLRADPLLFYSLLAALLLFGSALAAGWARHDLVAVFAPAALLRVGLGVTAAVGLLVLQHGVVGGLEHLTPLLSPLGITPLAATPDGWPLGGVSRLPLYVIALGYGPSAGLLAAGLYAAFGGLGVEALLLGLELTVVGWLAIFPSPRRHRLAGPFNVLLGFSLVAASAGIAWISWRDGAFSSLAFWAQYQAQLGGVLLCALLLGLLPARFYRVVLVASPIAPDVDDRADDRAGDVYEALDNRTRLKQRARGLEPRDTKPRDQTETAPSGDD